MAVWEARQQARSWWRITQVSWTDWTALDTYYWLEHSFQYSANINCDDEMHWIKLSNKARFTTHHSKCQLVSIGDLWVAALQVDPDPEWTPLYPHEFDHDTFNTQGTALSDAVNPWNRSNDWDVCPWVVFQDYFWYGCKYTPDVWDPINALFAQTIVPNGISFKCVPHDHPESTDESISDPDNVLLPMQHPITAMLNYNNTRLVVACWPELRVYYPELDIANPNNPNYDSTIPVQDRKMGWKKVLDYENWVTIVWLTCTFEYLKVWAVDEWWSTKVYFYQGNNNLRDTFVYNVIDLTGERVLHVYSLNGIDYYTTSIDGSDAFVNLYKMIGNVPVMLFHQRAWLTSLDVNFKAPYFVWPTGINAAYKSGRFYIADAYGVFQFTQTQTSYDKGYMKRKLTDELNGKQVYGVCENQGFLYVSTEDGCREMRLYDTGKDGYQDQGVLISREFEGKEWWTITKMLDEIRMNFEMNPLTDENWSIDIYVSPNNLWLTTSLNDLWTRNSVPSGSWNPWDFYWVKGNENAYYVWNETNNTWDNTWDSIKGWYKVMHVDQTNAKTRAEKSNLFNDLNGWENSSFRFDWQTITYAIVITKWDEDKATPIVRQLDIKYHCKDKVNNVYDIN